MKNPRLFLNSLVVLSCLGVLASITVCSNATFSGKNSKKNRDNPENGGENTGGNNTGNNNTGNNNTGNNNTGSNNTDGNNTGGDNTGSNNTDGNNTGGDNTGSNNTDGNNTGGDNTGSNNTDGNNTGSNNTGDNNKTNNNGENNPNGNFDFTYQLDCGDAQGRDYTVTPDSDGKTTVTTTVMIKGEVCTKTVQGSATVLFVVDYSSSIGPNYGDGKFHQGNDPQIEASCERLEAAKKIVAGLEGQTKVKLGFIPFADQVLPSKVVALEDVTAFKQRLTATNFCSYIMRKIDEPKMIPLPLGGISQGPDADNVLPYTNYEAALTRAKTMIADVYGAKTVYFISDGRPMTDDHGHGGDNLPAVQEQSILAAKAFRASIDNLTFNGLFLAKENDNDVAAARKVLEEVAGSPNRVVVAREAEKLVTVLQNLPEMDLNLSSATGILTWGPSDSDQSVGSRPVAIPSFVKVNDTKWTWNAANFTLEGALDKVTVNIFTMKVDGTNGEKVSAKVILRYNP